VLSRRSQGSHFSVVVAIAGQPPPASAGKRRGLERRSLWLIDLGSVFFVTVAFVEGGRVHLAIEWAFAEPRGRLDAVMLGLDDQRVESVAPNWPDGQCPKSRLGEEP
jgi:hypothetical protein